MRKGNYKIIGLLVLIGTLLYGCDNTYSDSESKKGEITTESETTTEIIDDTSNDEQNVTISMSPLFYKANRNGIDKWGRCVYPVPYLNKPIEMYMSVNYINSHIANEKLSLMIFININGEMIPFSVNDSNEELFKVVDVNISENEDLIFKFTPSNVLIEENNNADLCFITFGKNSEAHNSAGFSSATYRFNIATNENISNNAQPSDGIVVESANEYYEGMFEEKTGVSEKDLTGEYWTDFIIDNNETITFTSVKNNIFEQYGLENNNIDYSTILFCDDEPFAGFDGNCFLNWSISGNKTIHKTIDISTLSPGKHTFYTVTINHMIDGLNTFYSNKTVIETH